MFRMIWLLCITALLLLAVPLAAQEATAESDPWVCPPGYEGQTLNVYNWSTYIAEDTVPNFEEACGVTVQYDVFDTNEALLSVMRAGNPGYDIIMPSNYVVAILAAEEMLIPLDKALIPNIANVSEALLDPVYDPGNVYSLPYQWGTIGVGYNIEAVGEPITSWEQVWNYEGSVAWLDEPRMMIGVALKILGYDPNTSNPDEIAEARDYLAERGGNVVALAVDDGQVMLQRGDVDIAIEYNGDIFQVISECECDTYAYAIPEEGANVWVDNMAVPVGAPNAELAMVFINYILDPQVGADISNYTTYASPNQASIDRGLIDEALLTNTAIYPSAEDQANLFYIVDNPDAELPFLDAWSEIKVLLGQ